MTQTRESVHPRPCARRCGHAPRATTGGPARHAAAACVRGEAEAGGRWIRSGSVLQRTIELISSFEIDAMSILSSFFFKFADTILKKYSSTVATIFTGLMSAVLFGHALSINFCIGVTIVLISMHLFFTSAPGGGNKKGRQGFNVSPSMDHISEKEAKMLKDDDLVNSSIDERAQVILGGGADRAMLLPR